MKMFNVSVAKLVYHVFIKHFGLKDHRILITPKDHDGRNTHVSNLKRTDFQTIIKESYKIGRTRNTFSPVPVTQFDCSGKPIGHFSSFEEAAKKTGMVRRSISKAAQKLGMHKGYFWVAGIHKRKTDLNTITRKTQPDSFINESLRKRLGIKKLNPGAVPAFLNLSIDSMKGERWKDVPGYEGLYQASSYGRVKALQKSTSGKIQQWKPRKNQTSCCRFSSCQRF